MTEPIAPLWILPAQAAALLGIAEKTVRQRVSSGVMPSHRDGRFIKFTEQDLADYVASCARPASVMERSRPRRKPAA